WQMYHIDMVARIVEEGGAAAIGQPRQHARVEAPLLGMFAPHSILGALPLVIILGRGFAAVPGGAPGLPGLPKERDPPAVGAPGRLARAIWQAGQLTRLAAGQIDRIDLRYVAVAIRAKRQAPA